MEIASFDELKVTTMTLIASLEGNVNKNLAFNLLPITLITQGDEFVRRATKSKLPMCGIPGAIISLSYGNLTRGIVRKSTKAFKNGISVDICIGDKNINLKVSKNTIQMCGAKSTAHSHKAINYIIDYLTTIQDHLNEITANPVQAQQAVLWVKLVTRGYQITETVTEILEMQKVRVRIMRERVIDHTVSYPLIPIPEQLNRRMIHFLLSLANDYINYNDYCAKLDLILQSTIIIELPFRLRALETAMVNYNYSIGFEIDRNSLNHFIDDIAGFISRYDNAISTHVTVDLPYLIKDNEYVCIKRRKNKKPHHSFLVYRSGSVTQSGPGGKRMEEAYYLFMNTIKSMIEHIKYRRENKA